MVNSNYYGMVTSYLFTVLQLRIQDLAQCFSVISFGRLKNFGEQVEPKRMEASLYFLLNLSSYLFPSYCS